MKQSKRLLAVLGAVCALNFIGHLICLPFLPDVIPVHWNFAGQADGWGPKESNLILAALPALMLLLLWFLPRIDPKGQNFEKFAPLWRGTMTGIVLFFCALTWVFVLAAFGVLPDGIMGMLIGGGIGVLFILLGNYMPRARQNYTFGCRTPWALADEHNWARTQRMGGITFIIMGAVILLTGMLGGVLGEVPVLALLLGVTLGGVVWIYVYSFLVFKGWMK